MRSLLLILLALVTSFDPAFAAQARKTVAASTGKSAFVRSTVLPKWAEPLESVPATNSTEPVVLRLSEVQYWAGAAPAYLVNRAVQVNSSSKLAELGQFSISFVPAYEKLVVHRIAILRDKQVLDRTTSANVRVLDSENQVAQGYYTGTATAQLLLEDVKPGDTLWTVYSVEGSNPVFGSTWSERLPWTKEFPIEVRKATVLYPSSKPVQWQFAGAARPGLQKPLVEQRNGVTKLVFQENGLAAEEFEPALPPNLVPFPMLDFSEYRDWSEVAQWATKLFPNSPAAPDVKALARKFSSGSDEQRASQALHWVQDEIRYFSVAIGENSHRPQVPEVVLKKRFGDCKDKSLLLVSLYRAMGLQAQAVVVNSGAPKWPAQFLPSPAYFNHVIVRVILDGKAYFVDPTLQDERGMISSLAAPVPGAAALVVNSDTTSLITLPEDAMDEPLVERVEQISIPQLHGAGQLKLHLEYRGGSAAALRQMYRSLSSSALKKMLLEQYERTYPDIQLEGSPRLSDGKNGSSFVIEAQFTVPKILREENGSFELAQRSHVLEGTLGLPDKVVRKYPFWISAGRYRARYTLDVSLPSEARTMKSDDRLEVKNNFFVANGQLTWRGAQLNYYIDYAINAPEVPPAEVAKLIREADKLSSLIETKLRFKAVTASPEAAKTASLRVLDILEKVNSFEDMQLEALRTGKVPEFKLEESAYAKLNFRALCELTLDTYSVRKWNPLVGAPMAALHQLVNAHADKRTKDLCAVRAEILDGNMSSASKTFAKLVPSDSDPLTLMQAWTDFHANDLSASGSNLARFLKSKASDGSLSVEDAVLAAALTRRLGMPEASEITQLIESLRPAVWPMPLFHLLRGRVTSDELLAAVEKLPLAAREQAALEARFLIAQQDLAAQNKKQAAFHLNWLERYAIIGSTFSVLAEADKYREARADPDMQAAFKLERERPKSGAIIDHLEKAAGKGIVIAQSKLGLRYMEGDGVRRDFIKAQQLLEAAAEMGDSNAMNDLGVLFEKKERGVVDEARVLSFFRRAVENGNVVSGLNLGRKYWLGTDGLAVDYDLSFKYMMAAAELEETEAQFFVSRMYFEGKGVAKNDSLAKFWAAQSHFRKRRAGTAQLGLMLYFLEVDPEVRQKGLQILAAQAADSGCYAQQEFGKLHLEGIAGKPNHEQAFRWIQAAHLCGFDSSSALLGRMYIEGIGTSADVPRGMKILTKLEKENWPDALYELGRVYRNEQGAMTDKVNAADYFRRGAERGQRDAAEALAVMLHTGEGVAQDKAKAARYYEIAVGSGFPRAMNNLANMYLTGDGIPRDTDKALTLLRGAARGGHSMAMLSLAENYEARQQDAKNSLLPLAYYLLAARLGEAEASVGIERVKARADQATVDKAQAYAAAWKPGKAMPEEI